LHTVERSAGPGLWSVKTAISCLQGSKEKGDPENTISLEAFPGLDLDAEFAAPLHHDYRLQATSRFRGAGKDGRDLGPYPFESNVYFVGPQGDDAADGLAVSHAWKSIARAATALKPGDTLYLLPGTHGGGEWSFRGTAERPIRIAS